MRALSEAFASHLAGGVTTLCHAWRLTRADGVILALTDHDRTLVIGGVTYTPGGAPDLISLTASAGLQPGSADVRGAFAHEGLTEADLKAGLWSGARADVFRVNWQAPDQHVLLWSGYLSDITHSPAGFEAGLVSLKADFERPVGRVYARLCDAALGDGRCGVDRAQFAGLDCDQRFETCRDIFANAGRFRGFPHMPGPDAVLQGPAAAGNTGGKR